MSTNHFSYSTPNLKQSVYQPYHYQQQKQQQQHHYYHRDSQQTNQQQQLMNSRRAVLKLHKGIKELQQPQPQYNKSIYDYDLQRGSVNWDMQNSSARFGQNKLSQSKCKKQIKSLYGVQINNPKTTTITNQHQLLSILFQPFYQHMTNIHHFYSIQITKLQKKIAQLEKTLSKFIVTKIKNQKQNNLKWFQKQYKYEKEINQLRRKLYDMQGRQKLNKVINHKQQFKQQNYQHQNGQKSQQQQRSLLEGIDDQLQWSHARQLQINKFINSSVYRQSEKSVSRCQQVMPVTVNGGQDGLEIKKKGNGKYERENDIVLGDKNLKKQQYKLQHKQQYKQNKKQYKQNHKQQHKQNHPNQPLIPTLNTSTQYNNNQHRRQESNPQQIMIVDEQLLSELSNSNQNQQQIKKTSKFYGKNEKSLLDVGNNFDESNKKQFQLEVQQEQGLILDGQQSRVEEFDYIAGNSDVIGGSNFNLNRLNNNAADIVARKEFNTYDGDNDHTNSNIMIDLNKPNKNTTNIKTTQNSNYLTKHSHHYHHQHIPSLINSQQLKQNYTFTYEQKYLLSQIRQLKQILQNQHYQQSDCMLLRENAYNRKEINHIKSDDGQQPLCQIVGKTQKKAKSYVLGNNGNQNIIMSNDGKQTTVKKKKKPQTKKTDNNANRNNINNKFNSNLNQTSQLSSLTQQLQTSKNRQTYLQSILIKLKQSITQMRTDLYQLLPCQYCGLRNQVMQLV